MAKGKRKRKKTPDEDCKYPWHSFEPWTRPSFEEMLLMDGAGEMFLSTEDEDYHMIVVSSFGDSTHFVWDVGNKRFSVLKIHYPESK